MKLVLVDAGNLAYRAHFAHSSLSYHGHPTGILFGFLEMLKSIRANAGDRIVFCWDYGIPGKGKPGRSWRKQILPGYKANRKRDKSVQLAFDQQVPKLVSVLSALGYKSIGQSELEADDMVGLCTGAVSDEVVVVSGDKDLWQLLAWDGVYVLHPKGWRWITPERVRTETGVDVEQFAAYLALGGDTSDNIRPAPRVFGPKTAAKMVQVGVDPEAQQPKKAWLQQFPQLRHWDKVQMAYRVARIPMQQCDLPSFIQPINSGLDFSSYDRSRPQAQVFLKFCTQFGMKTLIQERRRFL